MQLQDRELQIDRRGDDVALTETTTDLRTLSGRLTDDTGSAAGGVAVRGIARDSGHELTVGETTTAADGGYSLSYRPLPTGSSLVVRALDATGHVLGESIPRFALADVDRVDLVVVAQRRGRRRADGRARGQLRPDRHRRRCC